MRRNGLVLVVVGWLFAGTGVAQEIPKVPRVDWGTFTFKREIGSTTGLVSGSADSVYAALPALFNELGLSPKALDPGNRVLELKRHRLVRKLGKLPNIAVPVVRRRPLGPQCRLVPRLSDVDGANH